MVYVTTSHFHFRFRERQAPRLRRLAAVMCLILCSAGAVAVAPLGVGSTGAPTPLFHGNWCGAGDLNRASPVDALDAACRAHDLCYERVGRGACQCDKALLKATA